MNRFIFIFGLVILVFLASLSLAGIPKMINYQGMLTGLDGTTPVANGNYPILFSIYNTSSGGSSLWSHTYNVSVTNGLFNIILGDSGAPINLPFDTTYWLGIKVGADLELSPRIQLTSVAYAYRARVADSALVAGAAGGEGGGWVDDGTTVRLKASSDSVGIGTNDPKFKTDIVIPSGGGTALRLRTDGTASNQETILRFSNTNTSSGDGSYSSYIVGVRTNSPTTGAQALAFGTSSSSVPPTERMRIDPNGRVGIGTTSPNAKLEVYHTTNGEIARFNNTQTSGWIDFYEGAIVRGYLGFGDDNSLFTDQLGDALALRSQAALQLGSGTGSDLTILGSGNVGIGTTNPVANLHIYENTNSFVGLYVENPNTGSSSAEGIYFVDENGTLAAIRLYDEGSTYPSQMRIFNNRPSGSIHLINTGGSITLENDGRVVCSELQLTGGSDIAEPFEMKEPNKIEPGMVVVIDPDNPGKLKVSTKAYDRCVAGIVSGAGGIKPGVRMMSDESFENNHHVALTGRVYALCDASFGSIEPGDLLTTSPTSGYAMKVTDYQRAQGAILGKAMTKLDKGQGLVSVLVTLQ
jgi:hypothetical protein